MTEPAAGNRKSIIKPAMERPDGDYHCTLCDAEYGKAGVCDKDNIPLRKRGKTI